MEERSSNIPEYSVSEISGAVKRTLEGAFGRVRVRGEITELKRYPSGHIYFSLKDEGGKISGVVWKGAVSRLGLAPENGLEVIAQGKVSSYGDRSSYQLIVDRMEYAGMGAMLARIEALRLKLGAEGLFDADRKRRLPVLPLVVGVVTSPQGAVIQDIKTTIARRFPRHILIWPVPVQGEGAAEKIAAAIRGFSALPAGGTIPRPDVVIVARGGGSLEDLMAFNDEAVVRAAAASTIPLISAVGHETDTTLIDFASDRRAPTPTAAAELAVPQRTELLADLLQKAARLAGSLGRMAQEKRLRLQRAERGLPDLGAITGLARQRLDDRTARLELALPGLVRVRRTALAQAGARLTLALPGLVSTRRAAFTLAGERLRSAGRGAMAARAAKAGALLPRLNPAPLLARLREQAARLEGMGARLESVSHHGVLARGYALVFDAKGHPVSKLSQARPGAALRVMVSDGEFNATVSGGVARQARLDL
ncbi:MAG: exodeoxyribonuclease VII large subunit [Acetobacteraceae bacterium]|nr:exodeoxyribonuclease VII large subunit [Acetobacteraceae bacterium]